MKEQFNGSWDSFNEAVEKHLPKQGDKLEDMGFWWQLPDIIVRRANHCLF